MAAGRGAGPRARPAPPAAWRWRRRGDGTGGEAAAAILGAGGGHVVGGRPPAPPAPRGLRPGSEQQPRPFGWWDRRPHPSTGRGLCSSLPGAGPPRSAGALITEQLSPGLVGALGPQPFNPVYFICAPHIPCITAFLRDG